MSSVMSFEGSRSNEPAHFIDPVVFKGCKFFFGLMPDEQLDGLADQYPGEHFSMDLATYTGATLVVGSNEAINTIDAHYRHLLPLSDLRRESHRSAFMAGFGEALCDWLVNGQIGVSSLVIANRMTRGCVRVYDDRADFDDMTPKDHEDFGRCVTLVRILEVEGFPIDDVCEVMAQASVRWNAIMVRWSELENLYSSGDYKSLNRALKTINSH